MATCVIPRHSDSRPAAASPEPITLDSCTLDQIEAYYERGLCRQALECAQAHGPLHAWQGTRAQILAGRIALSMGAPRLGRWLHVQAYRHDSRSLEARAYYASHVLERRGPLAAWKLLGRWGESFAQASSEPHSVQQLLLLQVRVAALLRDFEIAEMWYARAEQLDQEEPWLHTERAFLLEQEDRYKEALAAARYSLEVRTWYRPGVQMTAHLLQVLDRDEEALELLTAASTRLENLSVMAQLATLQMDLERFPEACATLESMGQLSPLLEAEYLDWRTMQQVKEARLTQQFGRAAELARKLREPYWQKLAERLSVAGDSCRRVKLPVRFVRQHHMTCAPATLAALSRFWQKPAEHLALAEAICYDGTPAHSERQWAEAHGWRVREFTVTWASAVKLLERGIPFTITTIEAVSAHLQAVIGYDELNGTLLLRDPSHYYTSEVPVELFLQRYRASGPRGMALVPEAQGVMFEDIDLPDAPLYDQAYGVQRALAEHRRDLAEALLKQMQTDAPEHRLTLTGQRAIAAYDAHLPAMQRCLEALLQQFPGDANLQLVKLSCLRELSPREERLGWLRSITAQPAVDPVFWQQYAQELRADAREQDTARLWLRRALRHRPLDTGNLLTLADLLWDQREFSEALQVYRFAACLDDKKEQPARSYFKAAQCLKRTEEALGFLRRRVERFGAKSSLPLRTLFEAYCELNQTQAALAALERGLEQRPEDVDLLVFGAEALTRCGLAEPAEALLQRAAGQGKRSGWLRARALLAEYRGDYQSALALWGEILELEPLQMEAHRAVTRWLAATQGRAGALRHLEQVCARFPYHFGLHQLWIGWLREESSTEAEKVLQRLLDMNPADAWSRRELALMLGQQARYPDALAQAELALQLEPNHPAGYCARGQLFLAQGNPAAAKADFRRALALAVDTEYAIRNLVAACATLAESKEALAYIESELIRQVVFGAGVLAYREVARLYLEPQELLASLRQAWRERPDLWEVWSALIQELSANLQLEEALDLARKAAERFPFVPALWLDLARLQKMRLDRAGEIAALKQALQLNPAYGLAAQWLAELHSRQGEFDQARAVLEQACARAPLDFFNLGVLAELLWRRDEQAAALERVQKALRLNANYEWGWRALIAWSTEANQPDLASRLIEDLLGHRPGDARLWVLRARTLAESGKPQAALPALESGLAADARCVEAYDLKAQLLTELQRYAEALAACQPAVWKQPPMELRARSAWIDYQRGNVATAIAQLRQALEENPGCAWAWKELAQWYWAWGKTDEAMEAISRVTRLSPLDPVPIAYRAALKRQRQEPAGALEDFQRAWQLEPTYAYAGFNLFELQLESRLFQEAAQTLHILREQVGGDRVTACQVQWHVAKVQHEAAGGVPAAKEPLELLRQLCRIQGEDPSPLETAITALLAAGLGKEVDQVLREAVTWPNVHPHVGALWARQLSCPRGGKARYPRGLDALCRQGEPGRRAVIELVEVSGEKLQPWLLRRVLWKHRGWLREHPQGREAVARALLRLDSYRKVVGWLADWRARSEVNLQVLHYLAVALRALGRETQAHEVVRMALAQPDPGQQFAILKLWHAVEEALAGNAAGAAEQFKEIQPGGWDDYSKNLYCLTRGVIQVQQAPGPERKEVFRHACHRIGEQFKQVPLSHCNLAVRREYRRCLWRMATDAGQWWRGIPAVCRTFHWAYLWGIPVLLVLLLPLLAGGAGKSAAPVVPVFVPILLVYWALSRRQ